MPTGINGAVVLQYGAGIGVPYRVRVDGPAHVAGLAYVGEGNSTKPVALT